MHALGKTARLLLALAAATAGARLVRAEAVGGAADEVRRLQALLAERDAEIARLRKVVGGQAVEGTVATLAEPKSSGKSREAASSSLSLGRAQQIAGLLRVMEPGASVSTVLPTGSMKPVFDEKSVLVMEKAPFEKLKVGDIVTYRHPKLGVPVSHRLIQKDGDRFWVKGDANGRADNVYVTRENYLSRVCAVIYSQGY